MKPRLLVITLGEATFDLITPWINEGLLPVLGSLTKEGAFGTLKSQVPVITPQLWATIVTGKSAGYHGLFDFWQRGHRGQFIETNGSFIKEKPIWNLIGEKGLSSGIVNVPFTYPPNIANGFMISGEDAPGAHKSIANPPNLYKEIVKKFGRYRLKDIFPVGRKKSDYLGLIEEDVEKQTEILEFLISNKDWNFFLGFYSAAAIAQHYFWGDMVTKDENNPFRNVVLRAYVSLDKAVGRLMQAAGEDTTIFVISDCGAGPLESGVQINTWLEKEGFLKRKEKLKKGYRTLEELRKVVRRRTPSSLLFWMNRSTSKVRSQIQSYLSNSDISWEKTKAFSRGQYGHIYVNLKGRDPYGVVEPGKDYEDVRENIIQQLMKLVDPKNGLKAVDRIYRREDLYQGPYVELAPDLVIDWREGAYMPTESDRDRESVFVTRWRHSMNWPTTGSHRLQGIIFAKGPGISKSKKIHDACLLDLVPTWLYALNQKIPSNLEGRVIADLFDSN